MQKLNDKNERSFMVVMKGDLEVVGLGLNIMHGQYSLVRYHFGISFWIAVGAEAAAVIRPSVKV
jgi:hypothetical protein